MALDLRLWAQLNIFGHVSYSEYLQMEPEEAQACFMVLKEVIESREGGDSAMNNAMEHFAKYEKRLA